MYICVCVCVCKCVYVCAHVCVSVSVQVQSALENLTMRVLGPVSLVQVAVPEIMQMDLTSYWEETGKLLKVCGSA